MIILALLTIPVVILGIFELSGRSVYGRFLPDSETLPFLEKHQNEYVSNGASDNMIYGLRIPFIGTVAIDPFCKWYIRDHGRISRWSEAHKVIEKLHKQAYRKSIKPSLSELQ
jgi:hypothetical protein